MNKISGSGTFKGLLDSVQFQIDGLCSQTVSLKVRQNCAIQLLDICTYHENIVAFKSLKIFDTFLNILSLLHNETDVIIRVSLIGIAWTLFQDSNENLKFESNGIFFCSLFQSCLNYFKLGKSTGSIDNQSSNNETNVKNSDRVNPIQSNSVIHRKRKFSTNQNENLIQVDFHISKSNFDNIIIDETICQKLLSIIITRWPLLSYLLLSIEHDFIPKNNYQTISNIEKSFSLCLISRAVVSSVHCQTVYGDNSLNLTPLNMSQNDSSQQSQTESQSFNDNNQGHGSTGKNFEEKLSMFQTYLRLPVSNFYNSSILNKNEDQSKISITPTKLSTKSSPSSNKTNRLSDNVNIKSDFSPKLALKSTKQLNSDIKESPLRIPISLYEGLPSEPSQFSSTKYTKSVNNSFLYTLAKEFMEDMESLLSKMDRINPTLKNNDPIESIDGYLVARIWNILALFEAACYHCIENQVILTSVKIKSETHLNRDEETDLIMTLMRYLSTMLHYVESYLSTEHDKIVFLRENDTSDAIEVITNGNNDKSSSRISINVESENFRGFNNLKTPRANEDQWLSGLFHDLSFTSLSDVREDISHSSSKLKMRISGYDVWISVIKVLINLTYSSTSSCVNLVKTNVHSQSQKPVNGYTFLTSILKTFYGWRRILNDNKFLDLNKDEVSSSNNNLNKPNNRSLLSPRENPAERLVFDTVLYLTTLLSNISDRSHFDNEINDDCHELFSLLKSETYMRFKSPNEINPSSSTLIEYSLYILSTESESYLQTIEDTDNQLKKSGFISKSTDLITQPAGIRAHNDIYEDIETQQQALQSSSKVVNSNDDQLPIAELILSAHAVLLIHSIWSISSRQNHKEKNIAIEIEENRNNPYHTDVRKFLPRKSWWFAIRILKAFLSLQGQTGVMLHDSVAPLLSTMHLMEADDASSNNKSTEVITTLHDSSDLMAKNTVETSSKMMEDDWLQDVIMSSPYRKKTASVEIPLPPSSKLNIKSQMKRSWVWTGGERENNPFYASLNSDTHENDEKAEREISNDKINKNRKLQQDLDDDDGDNKNSPVISQDIHQPISMFPKRSDTRTSNDLKENPSPRLQKESNPSDSENATRRFTSPLSHKSTSETTTWETKDSKISNSKKKSRSKLGTEYEIFPEYKNSQDSTSILYDFSSENVSSSSEIHSDKIKKIIIEIDSDSSDDENEIKKKERGMCEIISTTTDQATKGSTLTSGNPSQTQAMLYGSYDDVEDVTERLRAKRKYRK